MGSKNKAFAFILILTIVISSLTLLMVKPVNAQISTPIPIPLAPEFSVELTNSSYFVPVRYSFNSSSGQEIANTSYFSGYVDALNVTITIKNQPLALSVESDVDNGFKYFIEVENNSGNWASLTGFPNGFNTPQSGFGFLPSSNSSTILTFQFSKPYFPVNGMNEYPNNFSDGLTYATNPFFVITVLKGEPADFRVRAWIGAISYMSMGTLNFKGNFSDWNQLTITMANGETSSFLSPSPSVPEFSWLALLPCCLIVFSVAFVLKRPKKRFDYYSV